MIPLCNLHAHTTYCDGKNTAVEMVLGAIKAGCETLGFSGHSPMPFETDWCIPVDRLGEYKSEIRALKEEYKNSLEILLGIEYDALSSIDTADFDYVIGSVHHVCREGEVIPVDLAADALKDYVGRLYDGDFYKFCKDYYENMYSLCEKTECDIVGHFDLVTKFNEGGALFDEGDRRYRFASLEALDYLLEKDVIFEINTGALSRGYRKSPYPAEFILKRMAEKNARIMINSDTHAKDTVLYYYPEAVEYAKYCGVRELTVFKRGEFATLEI